MKFEGFRQVMDTMDAAGYDYKKEILEIEKKKRAFATDAAGGFGLPEHIRTMVYALLSSNRPWEPIAEKVSQIDQIFGSYDPDIIKTTDPEVFLQKILAISCGNRQIKKQMYALKANVETLEKIAQEHGSIDHYYRSNPLESVIKSLCVAGGKYKLQRMDVPLVCEYLKGLGIEVVKPDSLLCRLLGRLGYSRKIPATYWEAIDISRQIGKEHGISQTLVDTVLWQFCAKDKFELCTADPDCTKCMVKSCRYRDK